MTSPTSFTVLVFGMVLAVIVTVLLCFPFLPELSNTTFIMLVSPGLMGFFGYDGTVQPQLPTALVITKSPLPLLVNR